MHAKTYRNNQTRALLLIATMVIVAPAAELYAAGPKAPLVPRNSNALVATGARRNPLRKFVEHVRTRRNRAAQERTETFRKQFGPWAVVTGASSGIGKAYAYSLAERGLNVVLVSRTKSKLEAVKAEILAKHPNVDIKIVVQDLSQGNAAEQINRATETLDVGLLVNNAGSLRTGNITDGDHDTSAYEIGLMRAKTLTPASLAILFSKRFGQRQAIHGTRGGILGTASLAAFSPMPNVGSYGSSNAHMVAFHQRQHATFKKAGIRSAVVVPGPVDTPALEEVRTPKQRLFLRQFGLLLTPENVAASGLNALVRGEWAAMLAGDTPAVAVPGVPWKIFGKTLSLMQAVVPMETLAKWGGQAAEASSARKGLADNSQTQLPSPDSKGSKDK